ncbi:MAG: energy-coupling factor transporter transmembrane protein EcfT [Anaerolineae bacterium]|nr:energy-coupling factor transporter transmembrane protein EcfT [Anaerolineae bacterium]
MKPRLTYQPGHSALHRLHPLVKLAWLLYVTVLVFAAADTRLVLGALVVVGLLFPLAGLRLGEVRGLRLFLSTALMLAALQIVFVHAGEPLLALGPLTVSSGGVEAGAYVAARFLSVVLLSALFVATTAPNDLAYALMQAGLPYRYGFALVTALRLVPVFEREALLVYRAQLARGVAYDRRSLRRVLTLARQFLLPMLVSALGKVETLAVSMEGRCFGKYPTRTYLHVRRPARLDGLAVGLLALAILALGVYLW